MGNGKWKRKLRWQWQDRWQDRKKELKRKERGKGKDSKIKRSDECYFPCKNGIKGKACWEDSKILTLTDLVSRWFLSMWLSQKGHGASMLFCYDLFTRVSHRQTQSSYLSRTVSHPCREWVTTAPHNAHMPREKRSKNTSCPHIYSLLELSLSNFG